MPLKLPVLDDRDFKQLLEEAVRRALIHTPEWTNLPSDPGLTIVELFAVLTDTLLYRANRIPERNRLKFLQLLGIPLQPAAAAEGIITIRNERGPVAALNLGAGITVSAGNIDFITRDNLTVLPLEAQVFYKRGIGETDERYGALVEQYQAALEALNASLEAEGTPIQTDIIPAFYETTSMIQPTVGEPYPVLDLKLETIDNALYIALLAPKNVEPNQVRDVIGNTTISIGVVPALSDEVDPLRPVTSVGQDHSTPSLMFEIPDITSGTTFARYKRLTQLQAPDVLEDTGVVQLVLPDGDQIQTWSFSEPLAEGKGDFPPQLEDPAVINRLVSWIRVRVPESSESAEGSEEVAARLSWVGINVTRVSQAVSVVNEMLGQGNGEPDQEVSLANSPLLPDSLNLEALQSDGTWRPWRLTDDLLTADMVDEVYALDPEAGVIRFGSGLHGKRPATGQRLRASYEYGGGPEGNLAVGEISTSPYQQLQGGYKISNPVPTSGGDSGETTTEGERNIPLFMRHRDRLVTAGDVHDITWRTPGVDMGRVEVLPQFYPPDESQIVPGVISVLVIPANDPKQPLWPIPDRQFLRRVCNHLDPRRLVTTEIFVRGPEYVDVHLSVGVQVREGYYRDEVLQNVRDRLRIYLSALKPGGPEEEGWPLNRRLLKKDLEAEVARVEGVDFVDSSYMGVGASLDLDEYGPLSGLKLPKLATVEVRAGEAETLEYILGETQEIAPQIEVVPIPIVKECC